MMSKKSLLFLLPLICMTPSSTVVSLKLSMDLVPAVRYQQTLHRVHDKRFFVPTLPNTIDNGCWYQCFSFACDTICGGTFRLSLGIYDSIEFTFDLGKDTWLRPSATDPRIRVAFYAQAVNCTNGDLLINRSIKSNRVYYQGRNFDQLLDAFDERKSFSQITRCSISSRLDFSRSVDTTSFLEANVTSFTWNVALDNPDIQLLTEQEYFFDTSMPLWIEVPSDITSEPTVFPTLAPVMSLQNTSTAAPTMVIMTKPTVGVTIPTSKTPITPSSGSRMIQMNRLYAIGLVVVTSLWTIVVV